VICEILVLLDRGECILQVPKFAMIQDQFGRFLYWLNQGQNAAAVQAVAALATTFLTIVLLWATIRYVRLTSSLALATRAQLEAGLRPNLHFDLTRTLDMETGIQISNVGQVPVRLLSVAVRVEPTGSSPTAITKELGNVCGTLLMATDKIFGTIVFDREQAPGKGVKSLLLVDCTDLGGVTEHSFHYDPMTGLAKYFSGFKKPASFKERIGRRVEHVGDVFRRLNL
jgi:hypothetical protein